MKPKSGPPLHSPPKKLPKEGLFLSYDGEAPPKAVMRWNIKISLTFVDKPFFICHA